MSAKFDVLLRNGTWDLVPSHPTQNLVGCKWIFRTKYLPTGSIDRYKARLVAKGFHQRPGIDYSETFSSVIKPTTVRLGTLTEDVFMSQPSGFIDRDHPHHVLVGSLRYLSLTRPDIAYTVNKLSQFMHQPTSDHWNAVKRNKDDFTSTSAYIIYLGHNPISWSSKKQRTVTRSSTKAEYRSVASTAVKIRWICSLLTELGVTLPQQPVIYCDNVGATHLCSNPVFHSRMKHVALDYHFIQEQVQNGLLRVSHISTSDQLADALTKPLARPQFDSLKAKIGLAPRPSILRGHDKDIQSS
ncbi:Retrovirus-related Pol polyprotein from transposon RE2 [Vitis vinifera]|uniref:Retrovirus-related Pol polyprotein from transposon RE2 n=1 Tax=Vitis vinifera TaxID=29760 RepID=A0A438FNE7_VITVI|nr:Retrovirus-related Pol polyprotein from transposon RE2 [Vitis vinifera]